MHYEPCGQDAAKDAHAVDGHDQIEGLVWRDVDDGLAEDRNLEAEESTLHQIQVSQTIPT